MNDSKIPKHNNEIYKVMPRAAWDEALKHGTYLGSADDTRDGFIHLSAGHQLSGTLAKYYRGIPDLVLIAYSSSDFGNALKWDVSRGGDLFPHLYEPLPTSLAKSVIALTLGEDGMPLLPPEIK